MNIPEHRKAIDKLDAHIVKLLNERTRHVLEIGEIKLKAGEEIYAPHRERAVFQRICRLNRRPDHQRILARHLSRNHVQRALAGKVHDHRLSRPGSDLHPSGGHPPVRLQPALRRAKNHRRRFLRGGQEPRGLWRGARGEFHRRRGHAHAGHVRGQRVEDCRADHSAHPALPGQQLQRRDRLKKLYVHPQTLAQCRGWVQNHLPDVEIIETSSNARSAELAAQGKKAPPPSPASLAAERYGLRILESDIQDNSANATRFLVLGRQCGPPTGRDRTSLMLSITHEVGALHQALAAFRRFKLNMTKIESRPSKRKAWEYYFFVDCEGHKDDRKVAKAIEELRQQCNFVKVLGSYPNSD